MSRMPVMIACVSIVLAATHAAQALGPVESFDVFKNVYHIQIAADVQPDSESTSFACAMRLIARDSTSVDFVEFDYPGPSSPGSISDPGASVFVLFNAGIVSADDLDHFFPPGTYTFNISGPAVPPFLTGNLELPSTRLWTDDVPYLTGATLDDLRAMDVSQDFYGTVNTFTPGAGSNEAATFVTIYSPQGVVYNTFFSPDETTFMIPAGTLEAGIPYNLSIFFSSRVRTPDDGFIDAFSLVGWDRVTSAGFQPPNFPPCPADFNLDGFLDFTDFDDFVVAFENGEARSDFNMDGFLDFTDFDSFVAAFEAGC